MSNSSFGRGAQSDDRYTARYNISRHLLKADWIAKPGARHALTWAWYTEGTLVLEASQHWVE